MAAAFPDYPANYWLFCIRLHQSALKYPWANILRPHYFCFCTEANQWTECLYQRITWRFRHITPLFNLKISDWLSLVPEPGNIHWDGSHPTLRLRHAQPDGIRRQPLPKNAFAEIPALFYLIISDCHASRHNPLLHTFTGNNEILAGTSSHETGFCHPFIPA